MQAHLENIMKLHQRIIAVLLLGSFIFNQSRAEVVLPGASSYTTEFRDQELVVDYQPWIVTSESPVNGPGNHANTTPGVAELGINHDGVAQLLIDTNPTPGLFGLCSGSLLNTGFHILTAAHCVTNNAGALNVGTSDPNEVRFATTAGTLTFPFAAADVTVHPSYNGDTLDGFDVAVIELGSVVPTSVPRYDIVSTGAFTATDGSKFGFGRGGHGTVGSTVGIVGPPFPSTKRFGQNRYESIGLGAAPFSVGGITNNDTQLTYDFDNGTAGNDAYAFFFGGGFANTGLGAGTEANSAGGDSGGPTFVNEGGTMKIAGVTSYGLRLAFGGGVTSDVNGGIDSSFGEFSVDARVGNASINNFITSTAAVPEPSPFLFWSLLALAIGARKRILHAEFRKRN